MVVLLMRRIIRDSVLEWRAFAVWILVFFGVQYGLGALSAVDPLVDHMMFITALVLCMTVFVVAWPVWRGCSWTRVREAIGWTAGKGAVREIGSPGTTSTSTPRVLLSFERPAHMAGAQRRVRRTHLENSIATYTVFFIDQENKGARWMPWR